MKLIFTTTDFLGVLCSLEEKRNCVPGADYLLVFTNRTNPTDMFPLLGPLQDPKSLVDRVDCTELQEKPLPFSVPESSSTTGNSCLPCKGRFASGLAAVVAGGWLLVHFVRFLLALPVTRIALVGFLSHSTLDSVVSTVCLHERHM